MSSRSKRLGRAVIAVTRGGARLGGEISVALGPEARLHVLARWQREAPIGAKAIDRPLAEHVADLFPRVEALVFVLATGATVRLVAPLLQGKRGDPAVLSVDDTGRHVVALLGGHQSDANELAQTVADAIGARAVITTASDMLGLPALDQIGRAEEWRIEATDDTLRRASAALVAGETPAIFQDSGALAPVTDLPADWPRVDNVESLRGWPGPRLAVTDRLIDPRIAEDGGPLVVYRPPTLVLGVGCSLGAPADEIETLARSTLWEAGLAWTSVRIVATIDRRLTEPGIQQLVSRTDATCTGYSAGELATVTDAPTPSAEVARHVGTPGVCEPAAILASKGGALLVPKRKSAHATVAVARRAPNPHSSGTLWLVGIGPGPLDLMTPRARAAIRRVDHVIGYRGYLDMLADLEGQSRLRPYELGQERERAAEAIDLALEGYDVAVVSSGDVGIYGMAGLVYELLADQHPDIKPSRLEVEVVPGVTAASSANALLGAPLMLDFAAISLSDLLVPWETIRRRLVAAAEGDFVIVLYNPASARRRRPFEEALSIVRHQRSPNTPVGLVRDAYRPGERVSVTTLADLPEAQVDMRTVVVIGCSRTATLDGRIVTRRGYLEGGAPS